MSELINKNDNRATIRWKLLTGVSALALTTYVSSTGIAKAEDAGRPLVWVELGGQMELMQGTTSSFIEPFMLVTPTPGPYAGNIFVKGQEPPRFAFGGEGEISFQPEDSDWVLSADIRYGRSHSNPHIHHQSPPVYFTRRNGQKFPKYAAAFADTEGHYGEQHLIADFSVGKDVGIGAWGQDGSSNISVGVRSAQLSDSTRLNIYARPQVNVVSPYGFRGYPSFYQYTMNANAARSFKGVGPSVSWKASAAISGNKADGELALDWGINAAVLFGRQKAKIYHRTQNYFLPGSYYGYLNYHKITHPPHSRTASRRVTIPNVGGFVGLSMKYPNVKFSIGYRADVFLKAMDTGIDARKTSNLTFNGPYASISVGLGN